VSGYEKSGPRCTAVNGMYVNVNYSVIFFVSINEIEKCEGRKQHSHYCHRRRSYEIEYINYL
jgi:hypothetical protein